MHSAQIRTVGEVKERDLVADDGMHWYKIERARVVRGRFWRFPRDLVGLLRLRARCWVRSLRCPGHQTVDDLVRTMHMSLERLLTRLNSVEEAIDVSFQPRIECECDVRPPKLPSSRGPSER